MDKNLGSKMGNKFFLEEIFWAEILSSKFLRLKQILLGRKFCQQNVFGGFFASKISFEGKKRILGSKNVLERKDMGSKNF